MNRGPSKIVINLYRAKIGKKNKNKHLLELINASNLPDMIIIKGAVEG